VSIKNEETATELPRLRIHHIMLWMVAVALVLTLEKNLAQTNPGQAADSSDQNIALLLIHAVTNVFMAVASATLCMGIVWRIRGARFFHEAGHWLLLLSSITLVFSSVVLPLLQLWNYGDVQVRERLPLMIGPAEGFVRAAVLLVAVDIAIDAQAWRRFFYVLIAALLVGMFHASAVYFIVVSQGFEYLWIADLISPVSLGLQLVLIVLCLLAIREDKSAGKLHHWSHWCGILCWMINTILGIGWHLHYLVTNWLQS
jgi:xanthine/uracil permease